MNVGNSGLPDPLDVGLPPMSRKGLIDCDEYSPNYEKACGADGEDGAQFVEVTADMQ